GPPARYRQKTFGRDTEHGLATGPEKARMRRRVDGQQPVESGQRVALPGGTKALSVIHLVAIPGGQPFPYSRHRLVIMASFLFRSERRVEPEVPPGVRGVGGGAMAIQVNPYFPSAVLNITAANADPVRQQPAGKAITRAERFVDLLRKPLQSLHTGGAQHPVGGAQSHWNSVLHEYNLRGAGHEIECVPERRVWLGVVRMIPV